MLKLKLFDSAYPGSMLPREDGNYVEKSDSESLALALLENVHKANAQAEDWEATVLQLEADSKQYQAEIQRLTVGWQEANIAVLKAQAWKPISSAPTDGTVIICRAGPLIGDQNLAVTCQFRQGSWWRDNNGYGFTVAFSPKEWIPYPADSEEN